MGYKPSRVWTAIIVATLAGVIIACGLGYWALDATLHDARYARYQDYSLTSHNYGEAFEMFHLNEEFGYTLADRRPTFVRSRLKNIFLEINGKRLGSIADLDEADLAAVVEHEWEYEVDEVTPDRPTRNVRFRFGMAGIEFRDGELTHFYTHWPAPDVSFAAKAEGPYFRQPLTKAEMIEVFGEPLRIERGKVSAKGRLF